MAIATQNRIAAIPTKYNGVQFRSRLEARWASLFDMFVWDWEYEPVDLHGCIPDFHVMLGKPIIAEVKPITEWHSNQWANAAQKIIDGGHQEKFIILGAKIFKFPEFHAACIGKIYDPQARIEEPFTPAIAHVCLGYGCGLMIPFTECPFNKEHFMNVELLEADAIDSQWKLAGNCVQYKGAK